MTISNSRGAKVAAILSDRWEAVEDVMASYALSLRDRGWQVRGVIATTVWKADGSTHPALFDLDTCNTYAPAKPRADSRNEAGEIRKHMKDIACDGADLAVFHRFTKAEATGTGVAAEILATIAAGIPFLTTVHGAQTEAWKSFTNNEFILLPLSLEAMFSWIEKLWHERSPAGSAFSVSLSSRPLALQ